MDYSFYAIHWIHYENEKIKWTDDSLFYTLTKPFDIEEMKSFVRNHIIKNDDAELTIQNVKQISKEKFEAFGGRFLN